MDVCGENEEVYAIGWVLSTFVEVQYSKKQDNNSSEGDQIKLILAGDISTFKFITSKKYDKTMGLIKSMLEN